MNYGSRVLGLLLFLVICSCSEATYADKAHRLDAGVVVLRGGHKLLLVPLFEVGILREEHGLYYRTLGLNTKGSGLGAQVNLLTIRHNSPRNERLSWGLDYGVAITNISYNGKNLVRMRGTTGAILLSLKPVKNTLLRVTTELRYLHMTHLGPHGKIWFRQGVLGLGATFSF